MIRVLLSSAVALIMIASACGGQTPDSSRSAGLALLAIPKGQGIMCREPEVKRHRPASCAVGGSRVPVRYSHCANHVVASRD